MDVLGVERPIIVGHPFGGTVALRYGLSFPERTERILAGTADIVFNTALNGSLTG